LEDPENLGGVPLIRECENRKKGWALVLGVWKEEGPDPRGAAFIGPQFFYLATLIIIISIMKGKDFLLIIYSLFIIIFLK